MTDKYFFFKHKGMHKQFILKKITFWLNGLKYKLRHTFFLNLKKYIILSLKQMYTNYVKEFFYSSLTLNTHDCMMWLKN